MCWSLTGVCVSFLVIVLQICTVSCQLASLQCVQCSTSTQVNTTNLMPQISLIIPSMYSPDCRVGGASSLTTPNPVFNPGNSNPRFPTMCPTNVVPENNAEFRCGYYRGHLTAKTQDQTGEFTLYTLSLRCFQAGTFEQYGCEQLSPLNLDDRAHFQNLLDSRFGPMVVFERFVGQRCLCRDSYCGDISGAPKGTSHGVLTLLLSAIVGILLL